MRVLIAGGAGFIGSHLAEFHVKRGHRVFILDDFSSGPFDNLVTAAGLRWEDWEWLDYRECDVAAPWSRVESDFTDAREFAPSVIYDLASPCSPPLYQKRGIQTLRTNAIGADRLLRLARATKAVFVLASTSEVYGQPLEHPQRESYHGNVDPVGPRSMYDEAKRYAEALTMAYQREYGVETRIARIHNTYGPRMPDDGRVVMSFIRAALAGRPLPIHGSGDQTRSFLYVSDLVGGLDRLARCFGDGREFPVNFGSTEEITIRRLAELAYEMCNTSRSFELLPADADDPHVRRPDISRAKALLDWEPAVGLTEGLRRTVEWARA